MWSDFIKEKKQKWVGEVVIFDHKPFSVVDVDMNGALKINKASQFNETTAVSESDVKRVPKQFVEFGKQWAIENEDDLAYALASLKGSEFVANMSDCYAATCSELKEVRRQREDVLRQATEKKLI